MTPHPDPNQLTHSQQIQLLKGQLAGVARKIEVAEKSIECFQSAQSKTTEDRAIWWIAAGCMIQARQGLDELEQTHKQLTMILKQAESPILSVGMQPAGPIRGGR